MKRDIICRQFKGDIRKQVKTYHHWTWTIFVNKIQKNPYLKEIFLRFNKYKCEWCDKGFYHKNMPVLHHIKYDGNCEFYQAMYMARNLKHRRVQPPDCKTCSKFCKKNKLSYFRDCVSRLAIVHHNCNIHIFYEYDHPLTRRLKQEHEERNKLKALL